MTATANSMPAYAVYRHRQFLGLVSAVSYQQACQRAANKFGGRLEVELCGNVKPIARDYPQSARDYQAKRAPYATGDFEARRQAEIEAWKARA